MQIIYLTADGDIILAQGQHRGRRVLSLRCGKHDNGFMPLKCHLHRHFSRYWSPPHEIHIAARRRPVLELLPFALAGAPPALVVTGQIKVSNQTRAGEYHFSKAELERLQQRTIQTKTTWTPKSAFSGPPSPPSCAWSARPDGRWNW